MTAERKIDCFVRICFTAFLLAALETRASFAAPVPAESGGAGPGLRFEVELSEIANLTYQLDCLSGLAQCERDDFEAFWKENLLKSGEDRAAVDDWGRLRRRYEQSLRLDAGDSALTGGEAELQIGEKIRLAGLAARDLDDYLRRLDLLVLPLDHAAMARVVRRFLPPFDAWWEGEALKRGQPFLTSIRALLAAPKIGDPFARISHFYAPALESGTTIHIALIARPNRAGAGTSGQQIEGTSVVEFLPDEKAEERIDVVLHELCHFLFGSAEPKAWSALQERFYALGERSEPAAIPAYNLLNEGLASAFGNGMIDRAVMEPERFQRYLAEEGSFYNNPSLDRAGKALLPFLDDWLAAGRTMYDPAFVPQYVKTLRAAFGAALTAPRLYLTEMALIVDGDLGGDLSRTARRTLHVASLYASEGEWSDARTTGDYRGHPHLNALLLVHPKHLGELTKQKLLPEAAKKDMAKLEVKVKREGRGIYAFERAPGIYGFVIVGQDEAAMKEQIETLAKVERSFLGIYVGK